MNVEDVMTPRSAVVTVSLPGTRSDALTYLQDREFSSVPVVKDGDDGEQYRGLISREVLIERPEEDQLALLMEEVPTVDRGADLTAVARLVVEEGARRIPVVEDGALAGIITVTDIVRAIAEGERDGDRPVADMAEADLNTTWRETPLVVAEREIGYANEPYALVLDDEGEMTGIITEVDILDVARVVEGEEDTGGSIADEDDDWMWEGIKSVGNRYMPTRNVELPDAPVSEVMSEDVVTVTSSRTCRDAAQLMIGNDVEQLPLVRGDDLAGIVRDQDLVRALL